MKNIVILGATGSIGMNTLDVISRFPDRFRVVGLTVRSNDVKLEALVKQFQPKVVSLMDEAAAKALSKRLNGSGPEVLSGMEGCVEVARFPECDLVVSAIVGAAGLLPTLSAIQNNKVVALANKETLVMAGEIIQKEARSRNLPLLPIDSEHAAIFQVLSGERHEDIKRLILTASGGPLIDFTPEMREEVSPEVALAHPNWKMGPKISIDSATLMNKGLEVIEARWFFDVPPEKIDVVIHRQSIVHSMVEFVDRSVVAQMGLPDMRVPISYSLHYPERAPLSLPSLQLEEIGQLTFEKPDQKAFPLLGCAYDALEGGGTLPSVLNAVNEEAVGAFLDEKIRFVEIAQVVQQTMGSHCPQSIGMLDDVVGADQWARREAQLWISKYAA